MQIVQIKLIPEKLRLKQPFVSNHETVSERELTVVAVKDEIGNYGYGELAAFSQPFYTSETQVTARWIIKNSLIKLVKNIDFKTPQELFDRLSSVKGNALAKAAIDMAVWDVFAKRQHKPLADVLAVSAVTARNQAVKVGISIGIQNESETIKSVQHAIDKKYERIKLKIRGNADLARISQVTAQFPDQRFCVDANGSLIAETNLAHKIDQLHLLMIEDPFKAGQHQLSKQLQQEMRTPLCYDEPIDSVQTAIQAIKHDECRIISMKAAMIGGLTPALAMIRAHRKMGFPLWCGGLLEGGVGRATNLALASLTEFAYPGDISETARYYDEDYAQPIFKLHEGTLVVPARPGIGVMLSRRRNLKK